MFSQKNEVIVIAQAMPGGGCPGLSAFGLLHPPAMNLDSIALMSCNPPSAAWPKDIW
jgi:hypothetical protein